MNISDAIQQLDIVGKPVCIHASLKSFGCRVEGLLEQFLDSGCTVLVPTFSDMYEAQPDPRWMPEQNGAGDYSYFYEKSYADAGDYCVDSNQLTVEEMGRFPKMVLENKNRIRGAHPLNSFAAVGDLAEKLVSGQTNENVYFPLKKLCEEDGFVLLMGTDLTSATAIHYAEQLAGRAPFIRWAKGENGTTVPVRAGGCSDGFEKLSALLKPYEKQIMVGKSLWRCYKAQVLVDACKEAFLADPFVAHCDDLDCCRCNDAAKGGPKY